MPKPQSRGPRIVIEIDELTRKKFKVKAMLAGKDMKTILIDYIKVYIESKQPNILQ